MEQEAHVEFKKRKVCEWQKETFAWIFTFLLCVYTDKPPASTSFEEDLIISREMRLNQMASIWGSPHGT